MAAEMASAWSAAAAARRFNEAAANGRGNLPGPDRGRGGSLASMRPRRMAAEMGIDGPVGARQQALQ